MARVRRRGAAAAAPALLALAIALAAPARAGAQSALPAPSTTIAVPVGASPLLRITVRAAAVTIRTWDRPVIHVVSTDLLDVRHFAPAQVARALHGDLPIFATTVNGPHGPVTLPPETFSLASVPPGDHDAVDIRGDGNGGKVIVTVPSGTALILANVGRGRLALFNYRDGTFVARVGAGSLLLRGDGGNAYAEIARGPLLVAQSRFAQLRARTALGNMFFEGCDAAQIDASSIDGSIVYDDSTFSPGLARFESRYGNVALGIASGNVQIGAHSSGGKIFTNFAGRDAHVSGSGTDVQVRLGGDGPVVTAASDTGAVYLYSGSIRRQRNLSRAWRPVRGLVNRRVPRAIFPHPRIRH